MQRKERIHKKNIQNISKSIKTMGQKEDIITENYQKNIVLFTKNRITIQSSNIF